MPHPVPFSRLPTDIHSVSEQESMTAELERSKASVARLLKERDDLEDKLKQLAKELKQAINEKSVQVCGVCLPASLPVCQCMCVNESVQGPAVDGDML